MTALGFFYLFGGRKIHTCPECNDTNFTELKNERCDDSFIEKTIKYIIILGIDFVFSFVYIYRVNSKKTGSGNEKEKRARV